jgi:hypothetical protein
MPVASLLRPFTPEHVRETPDAQGAFTLWDGRECVYVGHTPWNRSLEACLRQHLDLVGEGLISASHFTWEITARPKGRESELLRAMAERQGLRPRYNRPGSPLRAVDTSVTDLRAR